MRVRVDHGCEPWVLQGRFGCRAVRGTVGRDGGGWVGGAELV